MNIINTIEISGVVYDLSARTEGQYVSPEELSAYTYDKATIDQKVASGGTFDPAQYYNKTEVNNIVQSAKTEVEAEIPSLAPYATHEWVENQHYINEEDLEGYATEQWVLDKHYISGVDLSDYATHQWVEDKHYITGVDLSDYATTAYVNTQISSQTADYVTSGEVSSYTYDKATIDSKIASGGTFDPTQYYTTANTYNKTEINNKLGEKLDASALTPAISAATSGFADSLSYNKVTNFMEFFNGEDKVYEMDCSPFLIDGMLEDVTVQEVSGVTSLVFTFNIDSGQKMITVPISDMFDVNNYYTKSQTSGATELANAFSNVYKKNEIDTALNKKLDASAYTPTDLSQYWTSAQTQSAITQATSGLSITIDPSLDSGSTNPVANSAITLALDEKADITYVDEQIISAVTDVRSDIFAVIDEVVSSDTQDMRNDISLIKTSGVTNAEYDSVNKVINFYNISGTVVDSIDATDFIKDGMIEDVEIVEVSGTSYLRITFNTESGHENIDIDLSSIFDANNYYTKTEVNTLIQNKADIWCGSESDWAQISGSTQSGTLYLIF